MFVIPNIFENVRGYTFYSFNYYWMNQSHKSKDIYHICRGKNEEKQMWEWSNISEKGTSGKRNLLDQLEECPKIGRGINHDAKTKTKTKT